MMAKIYGLIDPRNGALRYVGYTAKSLDERLQSHWLQRNRSKTYKNNWLQNLWLETNKRPEIFLIEEIQPDQWTEAECFWIEYLRSIGCDLTNVSIGGRGRISGTKLTSEHKANISEGLKGKTKGISKPSLQGKKPWNTGKTYSAKSPTGLTARGKSRPWQDGTKRAIGRMKQCWVTDPLGQDHLVTGINQFCKIHGLHAGNFGSMIRGSLKTCKGWTVRVQMG